MYNYIQWLKLHGMYSVLCVLPWYPCEGLFVEIVGDLIPMFVFLILLVVQRIFPEEHSYSFLLVYVYWDTRHYFNIIKIKSKKKLEKNIASYPKKGFFQKLKKKFLCYTVKENFYFFDLSLNVISFINMIFKYIYSNWRLNYFKY